LTTLVLDILSLSQDEQNEVYWSVCELVKKRLDKARSVCDEIAIVEGKK